MLYWLLIIGLFKSGACLIPFNEKTNKLRRAGLEDSLSFYDFPEVDKKRISSTNGQERLNMEIRRRSRVVGVFPSVECYVRLTICYLFEYSEDWGSKRNYIREDKVLGSLDRLHELMSQAAN